MNVARSLPVKAKWMDMPGELLSRIFAIVPFPSKFACQSVCVAWCKALSAQSAPGTWGDHLTFLCRKQDKDYEEAEEQAMIVLQDCPSMLVTLADWVESRISSWQHFNFGTEDVKLQLNDQLLVVLYMLLSQLQEADPSVDVRVQIEGGHLDCPQCELSIACLVLPY